MSSAQPAAGNCPRCGHRLNPGRKFCGKCGAPVAAAAPPPVPAAAPRAALRSAAPARTAKVPGQGLGLPWLVVPTLLFALLQLLATERRNVGSVAIAVAAAGALYWWKQQPLRPDASPTVQRLKPFTYGLQIGVVFVMIGGVSAVVILAGVLALVRYVAKNGVGLVHKLEPWWSTQEKIPGPTRKLLAFGIPGAIGWYIGTYWAIGMEWGMTLFSFSLGIIAAFLLVFTPPASMRRRHP